MYPSTREGPKTISRVAIPREAPQKVLHKLLGGSRGYSRKDGSGDATRTRNAYDEQDKKDSGIRSNEDYYVIRSPKTSPRNLALLGRISVTICIRARYHSCNWSIGFWRSDGGEKSREVHREVSPGVVGSKVAREAGRARLVPREPK
ncbi:13602_t:CDS:2, partial [Acaulospora colombiana]